tara:strand:+ start:86312 stop:86848 length:537 start_codon:yes stop_codon:yes gene_type:complete
MVFVQRPQNYFFELIGYALAMDELKAEIQDDEYWMRLALEQSEIARQAKEVPVGALLVKDGELVALGWNQSISSSDPTEHAEINCLRQATKAMNNYRIPGCDMYVTLEPCAMCAGAMVHARIRRLIFGAYEPRAGVAVSQAQLLDSEWLNHKVEVKGGVLADECGEVLKDFFRERRSK